MVYDSSIIREFASTRKTSEEIALAIFEIAKKDDEARMWESPSEEEIELVVSRAWLIADIDTTVLHWGDEVHHRPSGVSSNDQR